MDGVDLDSWLDLVFANISLAIIFSRLCYDIDVHTLQGTSPKKKVASKYLVSPTRSLTSTNKLYSSSL
jgi:hypothetical protein